MKDVLSSYFSNISDPRSQRNQYHHFTLLLGQAFCQFCLVSIVLAACYYLLKLI